VNMSGAPWRSTFWLHKSESGDVHVLEWKRTNRFPKRMTPDARAWGGGVSPFPRATDVPEEVVHEARHDRTVTSGPGRAEHDAAQRVDEPGRAGDKTMLTPGDQCTMVRPGRSAPTRPGGLSSRMEFVEGPPQYHAR
jgi:hypothetical protein